MIPEMLGIKELSARLGLPVGTLRNWVSERKIPFTKVGGRTLFDPREIERWLEATTVREGESRPGQRRA